MRPVRSEEIGNVKLLHIISIRGRHDGHVSDVNVSDSNHIFWASLSFELAQLPIPYLGHGDVVHFKRPGLNHIFFGTMSFELASSIMQVEKQNQGHGNVVYFKRVRLKPFPFMG